MTATMEIDSQPKSDLLDKLAYVLVVFFGTSVWITLNVFWVETPLLVQKAPEGQNLPSHLMLAVQVANIFPITYILLTQCFTREKLEIPGIHILLGVGTAACFLLIFFWDKVVGSHSVALLVLVFFMALVDDTCYLLFNPYMSYLDPKFLMYYYVGQGMSAFVPSVVVLGQGMGGEPTCSSGTNSSNVVPVYSEPRFSVEVYFVFMTLVIAIAWLSFAILDKVRPRLKYQVTKNSLDETTKASQLSNRSVAVTLFKSMFFCCFKYGILPSIQPNSLSPYGNITYQFAACFSFMSQPITYIGVSFCSVKTCKKIMAYVIILSLAFTGYILTTAAMSPKPPLLENVLGKVLVVSAWVLVYVFLTIGEASVVTVLRSSPDCHKLLYWNAISTQVSTITGGTTFFFILNYSNVFPFFDPCLKS